MVGGFALLSVVQCVLWVPEAWGLAVGGVVQLRW